MVQSPGSALRPLLFTTDTHFLVISSHIYIHSHSLPRLTETTNHLTAWTSNRHLDLNWLNTHPTPPICPLSRPVDIPLFSPPVHSFSHTHFWSARKSYWHHLQNIIRKVIRKEESPEIWPSPLTAGVSCPLINFVYIISDRNGIERHILGPWLLTAFRHLVILFLGGQGISESFIPLLQPSQFQPQTLIGRYRVTVLACTILSLMSSNPCLEQIITR